MGLFSKIIVGLFSQLGTSIMGKLSKVVTPIIGLFSKVGTPIMGLFSEPGSLKVLFFGFVLGIIFWGGFNTAMEATNQESFCISCHEMEENVYQEYTDTIHYSNRTGVRATCPDCHVPKEWIHKIIRKIKASNELYHKMLGTIDTPEKFEEKRLQLATNEWKRMLDSDSRECRNCHDFDSMDFDKQESRSSDRHEEAIDNDWTCIQCHKGIAHQLPGGYDPADDTPGGEEGDDS